MKTQSKPFTLANVIVRSIITVVLFNFTASSNHGLLWALFFINILAFGWWGLGLFIRPIRKQ